jgi:hypothetical protein
MGYTFKERKPDLTVSGAALDRLRLSRSALAPLIAALDPEIRTQVGETYSAIFK